MPMPITDYVQCSGTKLYYNPNVKFKGCEHGRTYKYGIIHEKDLLNDLNNWSDMFVAARLQKPVLEIYRDDPDNVYDLAFERNKRSALALAILQMPKSEFTLMDIFISLTSLSYKGDIRMLFKAEDPNKVKNIVEPNFSHFVDYYAPFIDQLELDGTLVYHDNSVFTVDIYKGHQALFDQIPKGTHLTKYIKDDIRSMPDIESLQYQLNVNLEVTNQWNSIKGILSGVYSTNPLKNVRYALRKRSKGKLPKSK